MKTHKELIIEHLKKHGKVTNQEAKKKGVTRLPVVIDRLKQDGHKIVYVRNGPQRFYALAEGFLLIG